MTLTQVAIITRRGVIAFAAIIVLSIISAIGYRIWYNYYIATLPKVEEKPNFKFGATLPDIGFPSKNVSSTSANPSPSNYSYSIDTETGSFLPMPKLIKVYFIPRANLISLTTYDQTQKLAEKLGFNSTREILSETNYRFRDNTGGLITIDLITGNFNFQKQNSSPSAKPSETFTDQVKLTDNFKQFLRDNDLLNNDLATGRSKVTYNSNSPINATSAEVSLWPANIDDLPVVSSYANTGLVRATTVRTSNVELTFDKLHYTYWPIDINTFATYPLKTADEAFSQLQSGQGFVSRPSNNPKVSLTSAYLAYYESEEYLPYLQPVYVFEGPNFTGLVAAVKSNP